LKERKGRLSLVFDHVKTIVKALNLLGGVS
jgi:hypothetical protein